MGWINRLYIKQLKKAEEIARQRMDLAREHSERTGLLYPYDFARRNVLNIQSKIRERERAERHS